mmetsp:Transcript_21476/g.36891  ORF Transcript_21476/g.36891 Transcript_21476/m.36891 type:complete len:262 (+) Transcript_21476:858-1643(+)
MSIKWLSLTLALSNLMIRSPAPNNCLRPILHSTLKTRPIKQSIHVLSNIRILPHIHRIILNLPQTNVHSIQLGSHGTIQQRKLRPIPHQIRSRSRLIAQMLLQICQLLLQHRLLRLIFLVPVRTMLRKLRHGREKPIHRIRRRLRRRATHAQFRILEKEIQILGNDLGIDVAFLAMTQGGHFPAVVVQEPLGFVFGCGGEEIVLESLFGEDHADEVGEGTVSDGFAVFGWFDVQGHSSRKGGSALLAPFQPAIAYHIQLRR